MNVFLSIFIFPAPLQRLILLGGGGLGPAWGPVCHADPAGKEYQRAINDGPWTWDGCSGKALRPDRTGFRVLDNPVRWSLDLSPSSPWPARLAVVAARLVTGRAPLSDALLPRGAMLVLNELGRLRLNVLREESGLTVIWEADGRANYGPSLPTLPARLAQHPPEVALLFAFWDVPEVRARIEEMGR